MLILATCSLLLFYISAFAAQQTSSYDELLEIRQLPSNYLHTSFSFNSSAVVPVDSRHYEILPRTLIQLARKARAQSIQLRFTRGRWNQEVWGALPHQGHRSGGSGIEVWAQLKATSNVEEHWTELVNSLSGLFCASMNFIDSTRTVKPRLAFQHKPGSKTELYYGVLPSETVCTENLTPFLKLLPCKGRAGISSLLTGHKMFDTDWSALALDVSFVGDEIEVKQSVDIVFDLERAVFAARDPIPGSQPSEEVICQEGKHYTSDVTCFPKDGRKSRAWNFEQIFGRTLNGRCAVADANTPALIIHHGPDTRLVPNSPTRMPDLSTFVLQDDRLNLQYADSDELRIDKPPIEVQRSLTSHGSSLHGKITLSVTNHKSEDIDLVYFSTLPWFMRPYLHSLRTNHASIIQNTIYRPAKDRQRPTHLELRLRAPRNANVLVTFDFDRTVLRYAEYPPDANRGFDVPAAVIVMNDGEYVARTTSLLLSLPTPDFSMPYNVIILTCTVVALCFGSMFNLLSRRIVLASEVPPQAGLKDKLAQLKSRILARVGSRSANLKTEQTPAHK